MTTTILYLANALESLTRHHLLMKGLLDLPPCHFDARKCSMAEVVLAHVPKPVLVPPFRGVRPEGADADVHTLRVLVRRVVDVQEKVEVLRVALVAKVEGYKTSVAELRAHLNP